VKKYIEYLKKSYEDRIKESKSNPERPNEYEYLVGCHDRLLKYFNSKPNPRSIMEIYIRTFWTDNECWGKNKKKKNCLRAEKLNKLYGECYDNKQFIKCVEDKL